MIAVANINGVSELAKQIEKGGTDTCHRQSKEPKLVAD